MRSGGSSREIKCTRINLRKDRLYLYFTDREGALSRTFNGHIAHYDP